MGEIWRRSPPRMFKRLKMVGNSLPFFSGIRPIYEAATVFPYVFGKNWGAFQVITKKNISLTEQVGVFFVHFQTWNHKIAEQLVTAQWSKWFDVVGLPNNSKFLCSSKKKISKNYQPKLCLLAGAEPIFFLSTLLYRISMRLGWPVVTKLTFLVLQLP